MGDAAIRIAPSVLGTWEIATEATYFVIPAGVPLRWAARLPSAAALQIDRVLSQSFLPERFRDYAFGGASLALIGFRGALSCNERPKIISRAAAGQNAHVDSPLFLQR